MAGVRQRETLLRQIDSAVGAGDLAGAAVLAERALALGPEHPGLMNLVAHGWLERGQPQRAVDILGRARILAPRDVHVLNTLGIALKRMGRLEKAAEVFDAAIAADPGYVKAYFNKGTVLEALNELDAARMTYERAVALEPENEDALSRLSFLAAIRGDYDAALAYGDRALVRHPGAPTAALKLAHLATMRGDHQAALELGKRALDRNPENPTAVTTLAHAEFQAGDMARAKARAQALLADASIPPQTRAFALNIVADVEDRTGNAKAAFALYVTAREESRRLHAKEFAAPGIISYFDMVERTADYFRKAPAALWAPRKDAADTQPAVRDPVFLLGFPRSGTTLLQQALAAHPDFTTAEEMNPFPDAIDEFFLSPNGWARLASLDEARLAAYRETYWRMCQAEAPALDGKIFLDKNPFRTVILGIVNKLFPNAKIIFAVRDPRDVVLSCLRQNFDMSPPMFELCTLQGCARLYDAVMRLAMLYREKLSLDLLEVRHEDVAGDFGGSLRRLCSFLGVAWDDAMSDVAGSARSRLVKTPSAPQLARGLYTGGGKWRRYKDELAPVLPLLKPWAVHFGYPEE